MRKLKDRITSGNFAASIRKITSSPENSLMIALFDFLFFIAVYLFIKIIEAAVPLQSPTLREALTGFWGPLVSFFYLIAYFGAILLIYSFFKYMVLCRIQNYFTESKKMSEFSKNNYKNRKILSCSEMTNISGTKKRSSFLMTKNHHASFTEGNPIQSLPGGSLAFKMIWQFFGMNVLFFAVYLALSFAIAAIVQASFRPEIVKPAATLLTGILLLFSYMYLNIAHSLFINKGIKGALRITNKKIGELRSYVPLFLMIVVFAAYSAILYFIGKALVSRATNLASAYNAVGTITSYLLFYCILSINRLYFYSLAYEQ